VTLVVVIVVALVLVAINALFVAAEFALVAAPRPTLVRKAAQGDRRARQVLAVITTPVRQDRYVATAQLGITLASLGLGMYGEHALADHLEPLVGRLPVGGTAAIATGLSLTILTIVHIVVGEMVPKGVALQNPERTARAAHWPMQATLRILYPFVAVLNWLAGLCLRLLRIERQKNVHEQVYTPEELQLIVEESERGGALRDGSGRILRELLEFGDLTASQVMVPRVRVVGIPVGLEPVDVRRTVVAHRHTRYPIYDGDLDNIVGMLHAKDLLRRLINDESIARAHVRRIPVVPETASLDAVLTELQNARAHMAVVIDEHGGTAGIVSLEDLFEEVVGELDEGVPHSPPLSPLADGSVRVSGTARLDELGQHFDLEIEHEEVESVSGLILATLGRPPVVGDAIEYQRLRLEVTMTSGRGVREARASLLAEHDQDAP
jgi:CBS domain containing-hemolysin-like protein